MKTKVAIQTDNNQVLVGTQTKLREEHPEVFVNRINFDIASQEERTPNEEPPTMSGTKSNAPQLESSHHEITEDIVATVNQKPLTEAEEDSFRGQIHRRSYQKDRNLRPLINFVKNRDWEAIKSAYGKY